MMYNTSRILWSTSRARLTKIQREFSISRPSLAISDHYEYVKVSTKFPPATDQKRGGVGIIQLNRPKALNALCDALFDDLIHAAKGLNEDDAIGCLVITGNHKAFAAGADIEEMRDRNYSQAYKSNMFAQWAEITKLGKPTIAAVNGFALGGGCELAMMCDIIMAGKNAKFGQPEINLGIIPGAGGTQRLIRAIGKSKAMDMVLTGKMITAEQAEKDGLVSRLFESEELVDQVVDVAFSIAAKGALSVQMAKEAVNAADEMTLDQGLQFERRLFHSLFATDDQKEGMSAFLEKRPANFSDS